MADQQLLIPEENYITPLKEILNDAKPTPTPQPQTISQSVKESLDHLFPEQKYEEKTIQKAQLILGEITNELTPEQLKDTITIVQFLVTTWLDDFERDLFEGLTLKEMLHEKGTG